jgi:ribonuclease J
MFVVVLTVQRGSGRLMTSPDIISRGFIYLRDSEELMGTIRQYLKQKVARSFNGKRIDLDQIKKELKDEITHILYDQTRRTPIVIPVINEIGGGGQNRDNQQSHPSNKGAERPPRAVGGVVSRQPRKFPPRQVPDTEVSDPSLRSHTETRAY